MKEIRSPADLAINGAPPAFDTPLHVGRPNIGSRDDFLAHAGRILDDQWLTNNGPAVQEFERRMADHLGAKHCVAMCNGTIALEIAIRALGLSGEVIVPSWTFVATAHSLYWQGITPVFADIDPATHNLDPTAVRRMITPRTSGIVGVHLWGRPAPVAELQAIADEHGLKLMFDAAHAFSCSLNGVKIGNFGACEVFSFHATKVFNTMEGGAVVTNDDDLAHATRLMRNFGFAGFDDVVHPGTNGKMAEMNAVMGLVNLPRTGEFIAQNRANYRRYTDRLARVSGISVLDYDEACMPNYQYVILEVDPIFQGRRDKILAALQAENVLARKYFWPGCHGMLPYRERYPTARDFLPNTIETAERILVLPTGHSVGEEDIEVICRVIEHSSHSGRLER